jgi:hypothetical protein
VTKRLLYKWIIAGCSHLLLVIALNAFLSVSAAGQQPVPPKATFITRFPFTLLSGGIIILQARLDNFPDTLNFILDTGSGGISLDSSIVENLKLVKTPT